MHRLTPLSLCLLLGACAGNTSNPADHTRREDARAAQPQPAVAPPAQHEALADSAAPAAATRQRALGKTAAAGVMATQPQRIAPAPAAPPYLAPHERERYGQIDTNPVRQVATAPVSTFSVDVDTGSWSNLRRFLNQGRLPPRDAVRVEECINYFPYDDAPPTGNTPFAVHTELAQAPWNPERLLMRIALKGQDLEEGVSTRLVVYAATLIAQGMTIDRAIRVAMIEPLTDDEDVKRGLLDLVTAVFG